MSSLSRSACPPCGGGRSPPCSVARSGHAPHLRPPRPGHPTPRSSPEPRARAGVPSEFAFSWGKVGARTRATSRPCCPGLTAEEAESSGAPPPTPRAGRQGAHGGSAAGGQAGRVPVSPAVAAWTEPPTAGLRCADSDSDRVRREVAEPRGSSLRPLGRLTRGPGAAGGRTLAAAVWAASAQETCCRHGQPGGQTLPVPQEVAAVIPCCRRKGMAPFRPGSGPQFRAQGRGLPSLPLSSSRSCPLRRPGLRRQALRCWRCGPRHWPAV